MAMGVCGEGDLSLSLSLSSSWPSLGPKNRSVWFIYSDYLVKEKTVLLQKNDNQGFGFVLRGAKAQTPIEEFTPTPAFPALQYLESVDEGGVAWRAGLRMGDFLIEVNDQNVVKVGHRQVVNMIRQGGNSLMVKVVMVTRNPEMEEASRKKIPQQSKRLTPPAIALRSKSMTSELEEMVEKAGSPWKKKAEYESSQVTEKKRTVYQMALNKLDEILAAAQQTISTNEGQGSRVQMGKRDKMRGIHTNEPNYNQSGPEIISSGSAFNYDRAQFMPDHGPQHGMMLRQKSIGVMEEEKQLLHPPGMKLSRSLSVPSSDDIPPPPSIAPPDPPLSAGPSPGWKGKQSQQPPISVSQASSSAQNQLYSQAVHISQTGRERGGFSGSGGDQSAPFAHPSFHPSHPQQIRAAGSRKVAGLRRGYSNATPPSSATALTKQQQQQQSQVSQQQQMSRTDRSSSGPGGGVGITKAGGRRVKGPLLKQSKVENQTPTHTLSKVAGEKSSIPIPTIIVKAPSTSSSGRSSQGSSVEAEPPPDTDAKSLPESPVDPPVSTAIPMTSSPTPLSPLPPPGFASSLSSLHTQESLDFTSQFGAAIVGAARRDRERFHQARRKSASFFLSTEEDTGLSVGGGRTPASQHLGSQIDQPAPRLRPSKSIDEGMFSGDTFIHHTRSMPPAFGLPEYSSPAPMKDHQPRSVPADFGGTGRQTTTTFIHPLTGKVLDPSSPLGLALAARERALKDDGRVRRERGGEHHFGRQFSCVGPFPSSTASSTSLLHHVSPSISPSQASTSSYLVTSSSLAATTSTMSRPPSPRIFRGGGGWGDEGGDREREGGSREGLRVRFSEDKTVHMHQYQPQPHPPSYREREREREGYVRKLEQQNSQHLPYPPSHQPPPRRPSFLRMESDANASILKVTPPSPPPAAPIPSHREGGGESGGVGIMVLPPPAPSVDVDDEFVFADPLPPPLQFANSFDRGLGGVSVYSQQAGMMMRSLNSSAQPPPPPPPPPLPPPQSSQKESFVGGFSPHTPLPSPQAGDSTTSSLTSYDSEVANLTQSVASPSASSPQPLPLPSPATLRSSLSETPVPSSISTPTPSVSSHHILFPLGHSNNLYNSMQQPGCSSPTLPPHSTPNSTNTVVLRSPTISANSGQDRGTATLTTTVTYATTTTTTAAAIALANAIYSDHAANGRGRKADHPPGSKSGESQETVVDSGIEELDSRSSSDHHLDNILGLGGMRGERIEKGERAGRGEGERGSDPLDSYITYLDGQTFEMHNSKATASTYPKLQNYKDCGMAVWEQHQQAKTAPLSFCSQRHRDLEEGMEGEDGEGEENGQDSYNMRKTQSLGCSTSLCMERPHTPELKPVWGEGGSERATGDRVREEGSQGGGMFLEGRKLHPPLSSMKASIINELSSKLQQMGNKGMEGWGGQRSLARHRFSEDSSTTLSPPTARSPSPLPTSPTLAPQPVMSPTHIPSPQPSQYPNWTRSPSPQPSTAASQPPQAHPPLSPSYSPYPTSPKHRSNYRNKTLEFQFIPSRESRKSDAHHLQRRRAPSPLISPSDRPKMGPPRPSSLPILPSTPLYSGPYELQGSITPPSIPNPLGEPYFSSSPSLFASSGALPPNSSLVVSRSLSPTHFLSGATSPPLHPLPPPACLSYPHLPPPPLSKPFAAKPLPYWTKYDVADWLAYLNLGEHRERFLDNEIDGTHLPSLSKEDYLDLGVTRVGHRMNIERALKKLMDRHSSPFPVSALSPEEGQTERQRDEETRS